MTIIPIGNEYETEIINLILDIQQNEFNLKLTLEDQPDLLDIKNFYIQSGGCFFGAFIDGKLVGTIALLKFNTTTGAIRKMFVQKEFRGNTYHIAQELVQELISYCKENGINNLYLGTISILKAAHRFYEKNNFNRLEKEELPDGFPAMKAENVFYHLNLIAHS